MTDKNTKDQDCGFEIETETYKSFSHRECEFFPCHYVKDETTFNCLFCYCPLYALGEECGGKFIYTEKGVKDCTACAIPHTPGGYDYVMKNFPKIKKIAAREVQK